MYWPYGSRWLKNPNILHLHMLIRQFSYSKILILGQNPRLWQHCNSTKTLVLVRIRRVEKQQIVNLSDIDLLRLSHNSLHFSE
jgi:hypothetical protein